MKNFKLFIALLSASTLGLTACTNSDDDSSNPSINHQFKDGIFVLAEGQMGTNNANVAFYKSGIVNQNIFSNANDQKPLGNIAQSILFEDNKAYIVVNGSNKIEVVSATTFISLGTITSNLENPRYAVTDDNFLYVSNWGDAAVATDDFISVYRLSDLSFIKKIEVKEGPEQLLIENNKLVIAHAGGWNNGNSVSIYNTTTNTLNNLIVGDVPSALVEEDDQVYILCSGITWGGTPSPGKLVKINLETNRITQALSFKTGENPKFLVEENDQLYYTLNNKIFKVGLNATSLPTTEIFTSNATYMYSFNVINNAIYVGDAKDFASNGEVKYYSLTGSLLGSFTTGIGPNTIIYN